MPLQKWSDTLCSSTMSIVLFIACRYLRSDEARRGATDVCIQMTDISYYDILSGDLAEPGAGLRAKQVRQPVFGNLDAFLAHHALLALVQAGRGRTVQ